MDTVSRIDPFWARPFILGIEDARKGAALARVVDAIRFIIPRVSASLRESSCADLESLHMRVEAEDATGLRQESRRLWNSVERCAVKTALSRLFAAGAYLVEGKHREYQRELPRVLSVLCSCPEFKDEWMKEVLEYIAK